MREVSLETREKMRQAKLGKRLSPTTEFKPGIGGPHDEKWRSSLPTGERHWAWQDKPSYRAVHGWIAKQLGKPMTCSNCGITETNSRRMHWANKSGNYLRDITDWERLCVLCHARKDKCAAKGWITRKARMQA